MVVSPDWIFNTGDGGNFNARFRHGMLNQCNFLFADGHAETRTKTGFRTTNKSDIVHRNFSVPLPYPGIRQGT